MYTRFEYSNFYYIKLSIPLRNTFNNIKLGKKSTNSLIIVKYF
jgi:hypothetical protein